MITTGGEHPPAPQRTSLFAQAGRILLGLIFPRSRPHLFLVEETLIWRGFSALEVFSENGTKRETDATVWGQSRDFVRHLS